MRSVWYKRSITVTEEQLELMRLFAERVYENIQNIEEVI